MRLPNGDLSIFYEVFYSKVYSIPKKYLPKSVERILDLGANIGCSTLYFHEQFPNAKIVAVEASKSNYLVLEKNLEFNKNITPIHAAINDKEGLVQIVDTEFAYNSKISANPNEGYEVKAITVDKIMSQENWTSIDLLKIDIEGAEKALLQNNNSWLQHVKCIIMEIHEPFTIDDVARIVVPFGYEILRPRINDTSMLLLINSKL